MDTVFFQKPQTKEKTAAKVFGGIKIPEGLSYPDRYRVAVDIVEAGSLLIRPFFRDDTKLYEALFQTLTPRTIYLRYFFFLKKLSPAMLNQLAEIDHRRDIALVALVPEYDQDIMIADARVTRIERGDCARFSILVADRWQGMGIGACLLAHCLNIARQRDIKEIFGMVLAENVKMLALGRKLGFTVSYCPSTREYELSKTFDDEK